MPRCGAHVPCRCAPQRYDPCTVVMRTYTGDAHRNGTINVPLRCARTLLMRTATVQDMYRCVAHVPCRRASQRHDQCTVAIRTYPADAHRNGTVAVRTWLRILPLFNVGIVKNPEHSEHIFCCEPRYCLREHSMLQSGSRARNRNCRY